MRRSRQTIFLIGLPDRGYSIWITDIVKSLEGVRCRVHLQFGGSKYKASCARLLARATEFIE